jgi:hypothetical protein
MPAGWGWGWGLGGGGYIVRCKKIGFSEKIVHKNAIAIFHKQ